MFKNAQTFKELKRNLRYEIQRFLTNVVDSFSLYKSPSYLSWRRKFGLELHFGKRNIVGFCLFEFTNSRDRQPLTPIYFYPFHNIRGIFIEEIKARRFFMTNEVLRIGFFVDEVLDFLQKEYAGSFKNRTKLSQKALQKQIARRAKQRFKNVKIVGFHV